MRRRDFLKTSASASAAVLAARVTAFSSTAATGISGERFRGLMIDAARLTERPSYYRRVIDFCHVWNVNTILFRLTDDQGSAFRFQSHPELVTHDHALTPAEAHDLAMYASQRGIQLIPEIESFGHASYITAVARHRALADTPPGDKSEFVGISPVNPDSLALMRDLYSEVAKAFPSPFLHAGCDEVNWGGSEPSRQALRKKSRAQIWAEYLNSLQAIAHDLGKELIVWGDFVAHKEPEILPNLNKRVIVMDWQYYVTDPRPLAELANKVKRAGLRVIGAPALTTCEWGPRPGAQALANVGAFVQAYGSHPAAMGVIVTNWTPTRYLANSLWDAFAFSAVCLSDGAHAAESVAFKRFVERHYGAEWSPTWEEAIRDLYLITPGRTCAPNWKTPRLPLPSASDQDVARTLTKPALDPEPYAQLAGKISRLKNAVKQNASEFDSFLLSADYLAYVAWREQQWRGKPDWTQISKRDSDMVTRLDAEWDIARFPESTGKSEAYPFLTPYDQLLLRMRQAAKYSTQHL